MGTLLSLWQPKKKFAKIIKGTIKVIAIMIMFAFLILPFLSFENIAKDILKRVWIGCAVCNLDIFLEYRKSSKEKLITPLFTFVSILTLAYLHNYWGLVPLSIVICGSIVIGLLEFVISVATYKMVRFTKKMNKLQLPFPKEVIQGIVSGGLYVCSVVLFILGHYLSQTMIFIFGGMAAVMLSVSILICIGNGISLKKNIIGIGSFIIDVLSLLALIIYLIYLIPDCNLQNVVLTIIGAVISGALTLAGVAWTIRRQNDDRKEEERKRYKPVFHFNVWKDNEIVGVGIDKTFLDIPQEWENDVDKNLRRNYIIPFAFTNSEFSAWYFCGLKINGKSIEAKGGVFIDKNKSLVLYIPDIYLETEICEMKLMVSDLLGNDYEFELFFDKDVKESKVDPTMRSYTEIKVKGNAFKSTFKENN